jgi:hypothetical protein
MSEFVAPLQDCLLSEKPNKLVEFARIAYTTREELRSLLAVYAWRWAH